MLLVAVTFLLVVETMAGASAYRDRRAAPPPTLVLPAQLMAAGKGFSYGSFTALQDYGFFRDVRQRFIESKTDFIESDLSNMVIRVYQGGVVAYEAPILSKGREGSWWETPAGLYRVEQKEAKHFSSFGKVYTNWNLYFQGNFFIHGWPYYPSGTPVDPGYSGGCIRLREEDAKAIYALAAPQMPVLVFEDDSEGSDAFRPVPQIPGVSAAAYLAADLESNATYAAAGSDMAIPIASLTKLMTAVAATEYLNLERSIPISAASLVPTSKPRLAPGTNVSLYDLLHLLILESSNEAAEAIARTLGKIRFVELLNAKAEAIGMRDTVFADASGVLAENQSSADDLFTLARYLYHNRRFILDLSRNALSGSVYGPTVYGNLKNFHELAGEPGFVGGKVGQSTPAGETMLSVFRIEIAGVERPVAIIVLGSKDRAGDSKKILAWLREAYSNRE